MSRTLCALAGLFFVGVVSVQAADWAQWRGPSHNGVVPSPPPLIAGFDKDGPKKLWTSEKVLGAVVGGWGSVSVADGKVYTFSSWKKKVPIQTRTLDRNTLTRLGWTPGRVPPGVEELIETARTSPERAALKGREVWKWVQAWCKKNMTGANRRFSAVARSRLALGPHMLPKDKLAKLAEIAGREFADEAALKQWLTENGFERGEAAQVVRRAPKTRDEATDILFCFDAATGKTVWKYEQPGRAYNWPSSSTPCVADGRCLVLASDGMAYAVNAKTGEELWKVRTKANRKSGDSGSFVVVDGVALLAAGPLTAFDPATGKELWQEKRVIGDHASCAPFQAGGKTYVVSSDKKGKVHCVDPKTGKVLWSVAGGKWNTPAIAGTDMVVLSDKPNPGLAAYTISAEGAKEKWRLPLVDRGASVVIHKGHVYVIGGRSKAKAVCVDLAAGKVNWEEKLHFAEFSSPIVAGETILAVISPFLYMFEATPARCNISGKAKLDTLICSSPAMAGGVLYVRLKDKVAAYDLRRSAP